MNNAPRIQEQQLSNRERQFYTVVFRPALAIAVGAVSAPLTYVVSPRDFVGTHIGWKSTLQGIPRHIEPFRFMLEDRNSQKRFSDQRVDLDALTGASIDGTQFNVMFELAEPWRFLNGETIVVELENSGCHAAIPTLLLHGYFAEENIQIQ